MTKLTRRVSAAHIAAAFLIGAGVAPWPLGVPPLSLPVRSRSP
jgi:hypothetical protein